MKTSIALSRCGVLAVVVFLGGCRADSSGPDSRATLNAISDADPDRPLTSCQVVRNLGQDGFQQTYRYNSRGLVSQWADGFATYIPVYDARGTLVRARYVFGDIALANIAYRYDGLRITREDWFVGDTDILEDVLVNTWNAQGKLMRRESIAFGVFTTFQYDALGNAFQVDVRGTDGFLFLANTYTFIAPVKSPDLTLRGLPYGPQFINYVFNPRRQTSAKAVVTDVDGSLVTLFDQDPRRSVLVAGQQQFALYQNFFDKLSRTFYAQTWTYQNCPGNNFPPDVPPPPPNVATNRAAAPVDFALRGSMRNVRQQIAALKRQYGR
ncbi:MAG: hypothetical protein ACT4P6_00385 [Gemmatimonadaceae bacterium]